ncbi:uncharacterized protein LOC130825883 isoform X3 [Amaranthus tricolor]|uniref:uncharacterized protein LOC130825883 isoform X3 n=1 Tax=Amaranthus tricolor TaxID=29722 RepID=UPI002589EAE9|nr:uncharacterized protein LOC130825883 isoform X3 [Amaranthus tricolor]
MQQPSLGYWLNQKTPQDLASVPIMLPRTPPPTPVAVNTSFQIDDAFSKAVLELNHQDMASHVADALGVNVINKNSKPWIVKENVAVLYVIVFTLGVLCGLFLI